MRRPLLTLAVSMLGAALPAQGDSPLTGVERTAHFEVHFRPGSRSEAAVDRVLALVEGDLARILDELELTAFPHTIRLYLYDDVAELQRLTGVPSAGHSSPLESHVPCDNDQTRVHELVHVVAEKFTESGPEHRNLFFAEGLANAVLGFVHGVSVDAVAAFYRQRGQLPAMAEVHALDDFYGWLGKHPGVNGYDIAGSWMRYLLDTQGAVKVRRYYKGVSVDDAFGSDLATLERGWHARLDAVQLRPGLRALLAERAAVTAAEKNPAEATLTEAVLGTAGEWRAVARDALQEGDPGQWRGETLELTGEKSEGDWCIAHIGEALGDVIVRCTAEPLNGCFGVQLQVGSNCQALVLRGQGAFLYTEAGGIGHDGTVTLGDRPVQIVLRRRGGKASIWIDGKLIAEGEVGDAAACLGVGSVGGAARFTAIAVRRL